MIFKRRWFVLINKKKIIYIVVAVVAICALFAAAVVFYNRSNDSAGTLPDSAEETFGDGFTVPAEDISSLATVPNLSETVPQASVSTPVANTMPTSAPTAFAPSTEPASRTLSKGEIVSLFSAAVNKTRSFTGAVSVQHTEGFTADIQSITGGELVKTMANKLIGMVVAPVNETLQFSGGSAVNSEGDTVALLLPKKGVFSLPESGVVTAVSSQSGQNTVVDLTLVSESVGMNEVPAVNASAIGYLDVGSLDISLLTVQSANITYTGSKIHAVINPDGYIASVTYTIPLRVEGMASALGISGSAVFVGEETESWTVQW